MTEKSKKFCEDAIKFYMKEFPELDKEDIEMVMELFPCEGDYEEEKEQTSPFTDFVKKKIEKPKASKDKSKKKKEKLPGIKSILRKIVDRDD